MNVCAGAGAGVLETVRFRLSGRGRDQRGIDDHAAMLWGFRGNAEGGEGWSENRDQGWSDLRTECCADCEGTGVWHPVAYR